MTIWSNPAGSNRQDYDDSIELERFERISHRRDGACPVRSHASRIKAQVRSRGGAAARRKAREFNGANRRGRHRQLAVAF